MRLISAAVFLLTFVANLHGDEIRGKVVRIADGDTITVLDANKVQHKIRLAEIDAPEKGQAFGTKSKERMSEKVGDKEVVVHWTKKDRYGRIVGDVLLGERRINLEMIQDGLAWHYKRYSKSRELAEAEEEARKAKKGLWVDKEPVPPWEYRKQEREKKEKTRGQRAAVPVVQTLLLASKPDVRQPWPFSPLRPSLRSQPTERPAGRQFPPLKRLGKRPPSRMRLAPADGITFRSGKMFDEFANQWSNRFFASGSPLLRGNAMKPSTLAAAIICLSFTASVFADGKQIWIVEEKYSADGPVWRWEFDNSAKAMDFFNANKQLMGGTDGYTIKPPGQALGGKRPEAPDKYYVTTVRQLKNGKWVDGAVRTFASSTDARRFKQSADDPDTNVVIQEKESPTGAIHFFKQPEWVDVKPATKAITEGRWTVTFDNDPSAKPRDARFDADGTTKIRISGEGNWRDAGTWTQNGKSVISDSWNLTVEGDVMKGYMATTSDGKDVKVKLTLTRAK
ncbi:MAG TPA: thermonuclease family protein [Pirellulales bacterium]|jgi:endonuclease YncB( thermonuclease family)|nr:thermonuclease family protein [Pirellulales bacterium]